MGWPPTPSAGFTNNGTSVVWGTDGVYGSYIVVSLRDSIMGTEIPIENGTGLTATQILLNDGQMVDLTVVDTGQGPPAFGSTVTVNGPFSSTSFIVVQTSENAARKKEGEISFTAKKYMLI